MKKGYSIAIIGSQWGDEGKGKITDLLAKKANVVVRYSGGDNAGHTIIHEGKKIKLSLIPSGSLNNLALNIIGNGCVVNPEKFLEELEYLRQNGFRPQVYLSNRAHVIFSYHKIVDKLQEQTRGKNAIGTTQKGIGPCYKEKIERQGIRVCDLINPEFLRPLLKANIKNINEQIKILNVSEPQFNFDKEFQKYSEIGQKIKPYVKDTSYELNKLFEQGKKVLFEGAQGALLDIDHGTYPFVTSSNPIPGSISSGTGISPRYINEIIGITKAYNTRVGSGPFPSEMDEKLAAVVREKGKEYGTVSGRPRRIGWFDCVIFNHSKRVSGYTSLAIMLLDVLSDMDKIKICVGYKLGSQTIDYVPANIRELEDCKPIFIEVPGWKEDISKCKSFAKLPKNAKLYIKKIEDLTKSKVHIVSVGPSREQTFYLKKFF